MNDLSHISGTQDNSIGGPMCLHEWFEHQVDATPDATAVIYEGQSWSYRELNRRANAIARQLMSYGVQVGDIVALCLERNGDLIPGLLGILKAGAAYAPIDPTYPFERLQFIISDCAAAAVVSTADLAGQFGMEVQTLVDVDHPTVANASTQSEFDANLACSVTPDQLAYVIYTSGSTGQPKGVLVSHANVTRLFTSTHHWFQFSERDTWTMFHSFAFDFSVWEMWGALLYGGQLIVVPYTTSRSPAAFYRLLSEQQVTMLSQTPSSFRQLMREDERLHADWPLALRAVVFGGEALEFSSLRPWIERHGDQMPKLINMYGITETTVHVTYREVAADDIQHETSSLVGVPIPDLELFVLDESQQPVAPGTIGEIFVGGAGVSKGYLNRPELTAARFIANPFADALGPVLYKTGDLGCLRPDGELEYHGRSDRQVQLRGFRVELGEIESRLQLHESVGQAIAMARLDESGMQQLVAYIIPAADDRISSVALRAHAAETLPSYMVPQFFVEIDNIPLTDNGKLDAEALPAPESSTEREYTPPATRAEELIAGVWADLIKLDRVSTSATFFELGGQSLMLADMERRLDALFPGKFAVVDLFQHPTIAKLAGHVMRGESQLDELPEVEAGDQVATSPMLPGLDLNEPIAIVGMAGQFPGAATIEVFWENLKKGVESIRRVAGEELVQAGIPVEHYTDPKYVPFTASIDGVDLFDAEFFGLSPHEATITDPQHRLFLECAWSALEHAGYDPQRTDRRIGVFAGARPNSYRELVHRAQGEVDPSTAFQTLISNEKDFLATRISHRMDLRGPSMTVQTGCSTSLVAVQLACQALRTHQCSMALAGGVSVNLEHRYGYMSEEGMILSPDGHVRAFDEAAAGTVFGEGVAAVVLKRLSDAIQDGDTIHAVIKAVALNNDGAAKVSYAAPSIDGQAEVVTLAHLMSQVPADSIGYVEAHGTGTYVGDPVEIAALTQAFRRSTDRTQFCAIGSVKTNVGHQDVAAGITGLIKAALCVRDGVIAPSLHFERPNRQANFESSPFFVAGRLQGWPATAGVKQPRRAGVSSFGIGGTNAHAILEQAPGETFSVDGHHDLGKPSGEAGERPAPHLLVVSARDEVALEQATTNLVRHLQVNQDLKLADVANTLQRGRRAFRHRRAVVGRTVEDAISRLADPRGSHVVRGTCRDGREETANVVFMFPGQGSQYVNMARGLYESVPSFREDIDHCSELALPALEVDLRQVMFRDTDDPEQREADQAMLTETWLAQPAIFTVEYALARLWFRWGVRPAALVGHSIGEYAAACLAGVFSLETAIALTTLRGQLLYALPRGAMLAVSLPLDALEPMLPDTLAVAAVNSPSSCVVAGAIDAVQAWACELASQEIAHRPLQTSHAFHSPMTEPILETFAEAVAQYPLHEPNLPVISTVTGDWIREGEMSGAKYWANNIRQAVQFSASAAKLLEGGHRFYLEVGPGQTLCSLMRSQDQFNGLAVRSTRHPQEQTDDADHMTLALGQLWVAGARVDWPTQAPGSRRVPLPSYPFQRKRFWVDASIPGAHVTCGQALQSSGQPKRQAIVAASPRLMNAEIAAALPQQHNAFSDWFYVEDWERAEPDHRGSARDVLGAWLWLVPTDQPNRLSEVQQLADVAAVVQPGSGYAQVDARSFTIDPDDPSHYDRLFAELISRQAFPTRIVHAWKWGDKNSQTDIELLDEQQSLGLYCLQHLIQALGRLRLPHALQLDIVSDGVFAVATDDPIWPEHATLIGACKVIPLEYPEVTCRLIDVPAEDVASLQQALQHTGQDRLAAYRGGQRFLPTVKPQRLDESCENLDRLKPGGTYLITGGLGGIGHAIARFLACTVKANLVLIGRTPLPDRSEWHRGLAESALPPRTQQMIQRLQELEGQGARVMHIAADVADREALRDAIAQAEAEVGAIDGVVHSAGVADTAGAIQLRTREMTESMLSSKVRGTLALEDVLAGKSLDFWVLFSSISNVLYHNRYGQLSYVAGNQFLEAFAARLKQRGQFAVAIAWDEWQDVGMAAEVAADFAASFGGEQQLFDPLDSFSPQDGERMFHRALSSEASTVLISTRDLRRRVQLDIHAKSPFLEAAREMTGTSESLQTPTGKAEQVGISGEQQIVQMWQRILGADQIDKDDNYFALGGDSLSAVRFLAELKRKFGEQVSFATMVEFPTPAKLADYLELDRKLELENAAASSEAAAAPALLKPHTTAIGISPEGALPPLFLTHAADGYTLIYNELADRLDPDIPIYGLPSPALHGHPLESIETLAAQHVAAIRAVRPHGPYLLAGYCMGGTVAFEVARQLREAGEDVPLLIGMETYHWKTSLAPSKLAHVRAYYYFQKLDFHFRNFWILNLEQKRAFLAEKLKVANRRRRVWLSNLLGSLQKQVDESSSLDPGQIWHRHDEIAEAYEPPSYDGRCVIFRAKKDYVRYMGDELPVQGGPDVYRLPVYPAGMLVMPFVDVLGAQMTQCIINALEENGYLIPPA